MEAEELVVLAGQVGANALSIFLALLAALLVLVAGSSWAFALPFSPRVQSRLLQTGFLSLKWLVGFAIVISAAALFAGPRVVAYVCEKTSGGNGSSQQRPHARSSCCTIASGYFRSAATTKTRRVVMTGSGVPCSISGVPIFGDRTASIFSRIEKRDVYEMEIKILSCSI